LNDLLDKFAIVGLELMRNSYVKNEYLQVILQSTERPQLASQKDADCEIIHNFIRTADNLPRPPSLAGVALLCDLAPPIDEHEP
jgi:hypothetical protein